IVAELHFSGAALALLAVFLAIAFAGMFKGSPGLPVIQKSAVLGVLSGLFLSLAYGYQYYILPHWGQGFVASTLASLIFYIPVALTRIAILTTLYKNEFSGGDEPFLARAWRLLRTNMWLAVIYNLWYFLALPQAGRAGAALGFDAFRFKMLIDVMANVVFF